MNEGPDDQAAFSMFNPAATATVFQADGDEQDHLSTLGPVSIRRLHTLP